MTEHVVPATPFALTCQYADARRHVPVGRRPGRQSRRRGSRMHRAMRLVGWVVTAVLVVEGSLGVVDLVRELVGVPWSLYDQDWLLWVCGLAAAGWGLVRWLQVDAVNWIGPAADVAVWADRPDLTRGEGGWLRLQAMAPLASPVTTVALMCAELWDTRVGVGGRIPEDGSKLPVRATWLTPLGEWVFDVDDHGHVWLEVPVDPPPSYEGRRVSVMWTLVPVDDEGAAVGYAPVWVR